jgi:threonine dehydrogenase-like Zn-dependent dehydrogenase
MLAADADLVDAMITHRFPIEDAAEAFRVASDKTSGALRVVLDPTS